MTNRKRSLHKSEAEYVLVRADRFEPTWAAKHFRDLRTVLPGCRNINVMGDPAHRVTFNVIAANTVGDESLLIAETFGNEVQYHVLIRQGDVELELRVHNGWSETQVRTLMSTAAQRLCEATPTC